MTLAEMALEPVNSRQTQAVLLGIGTAVPPTMAQTDVATAAETINCQTDQHRAFLRRVFLRCGVEQRGSVLKSGTDLETVRAFYHAPVNIDDRGPTTAVRMQRYAQEAPPLLARAATEALNDAGLAPEAITHLITVSCTGFFAPGLDVETIQRLGLAPSVKRLHIGFMGCHATFNALSAARAIVRADPSALVLVCSVELSTLHFSYGFDPQKLIGNALFADGSSACVVGDRRVGRGEALPDGALWRIVASASQLVPESWGAMTWTIGDHGFEMVLGAELPDLIQKNLRPWCERWLGENGLSIGDIKRWAIHPGGPKILSAAAASLNLAETDLKASRAVLARHGNMSSATLLFLLHELAMTGGQDDADGLCVAIGFGPGLMAEGLLLEYHGQK